MEDIPKAIPEANFEPKQISYLRTYQAPRRLRFISATALFDGHDASINLMRRLLQARGVELIHLGHNRSALELAQAALDEDVDGIAISSYQGGHMEFLQYLRKILDQEGGGHIKLFCGGGGVISNDEIHALKDIATVYSPELGQQLGLEGMIGHLLWSAQQETDDPSSPRKGLARAISKVERGEKVTEVNFPKRKLETPPAPVLGITGTGGAGKSSLLDEILARFCLDFPQMQIAVLCVDPVKRKTGGALLGDRLRINSCKNKNIFLRSLSASGGSELHQRSHEIIKLLRNLAFDLIILETSGIGQGDMQVLELSDISLYVMTPEFGADTQLEKINMLDYADLVVINKYERPQGPDAVKSVEKTLRRSRYQGVAPQQYPVFGTIASRFNDDGCHGLYQAICKQLDFDLKCLSPQRNYARLSTQRQAIIPGHRNFYLNEIATAVRKYHSKTKVEVAFVQTAEALDLCAQKFPELESKAKEAWQEVCPELRKELTAWPQLQAAYGQAEFKYTVRGKQLSTPSRFHSLSQENLPRVALPNYVSQADLAKFLRQENLPGHFPFVSAVFPFRRQESPKRQFAGEGGPQRTNQRFHYLSANETSQRLSTAFDSVTLYGSDPDIRPDIFGKVGESGVSIATLDDMHLLLDGFDLCSPSCSVSMTINGPAPIILAMYFNVGIDQALAKNDDPAKVEEVEKAALQAMRGTVQADILKEEQAQNTCIFSIDFALKMMGDIQEYFSAQQIKNYYAVSISGYHIAEAGANPITQLAFTLANGFTYVEYYLHRGLQIDDFANNLSFFFSNGLDPEYAVLGRVARRIWAIAMRDYYGAGIKAQKFKYHIQTSGRSLHAQEMDFNDIRTTLQALLALYDNCNSLHTNAYDEAFTTPTEESVRRAMAIQLIINEEFGPNKCENINQGSFFISELTDLVEEAVLQEFENIAARGGVLGAMETQYQRNKIQEESMLYEQQKHSGTLPIVGVNVFKNTAAESRPQTQLSRASYAEKEDQIARLAAFKEKNRGKSEAALERLKEKVTAKENIFEALMDTVRYCSLGEISDTLYALGGEYRRSV